MAGALWSTYSVYVDGNNPSQAYAAIDALTGRIKINNVTLQDDEEFNNISITFTKKTTYKSKKINNHYLIEINTTENKIIADNDYMKDYIIMWIEFNLKKGIKKDVDLLIPKNIESIKNILKNVNIDINNNTLTNKDQLENMINELTYELYGIKDEEELKIIKDFLKKFS